VEACVLTVAKSGLIPPIESRFMNSGVLEDWSQRADALAKAGSSMCQRLAKDFPLWSIQAESAAGAPADIILERASTWHPDLIVVGTHGRSVVLSTVLGSVSRKLIVKAPCTVRVGRAGTRHNGPIQVVIGADGSPESDAAIDEVSRRSWPAGSMAHIVAIFEPVPPTIGELAVARADELRDVDQLQREHLQAAVKRCVAMLAASGLSVHGDLLEGNPRDVLLREASALGADVIFIGARDLSSAERFLFGLSQDIALHATCAVEVVHRRKEAEVVAEHVSHMDFAPL